MPINSSIHPVQAAIEETREANRAAWRERAGDYRLDPEALARARGIVAGKGGRRLLRDESRAVALAVMTSPTATARDALAAAAHAARVAGDLRDRVDVNLRSVALQAFVDMTPKPDVSDVSSVPLPHVPTPDVEPT